MRALVVDSSREECAAMTLLVRRAGYDVMDVTSLDEARNALAEGWFDLVLLDLELPGGAGRGLCYELRERLGEGAVIILLGARNTPSARTAGLQLGADDCLDKPYDAEELLMRIHVIQQRRRILGAP